MMRVPLRFQVTEYDCGTTSLMNAISYLFDREEISAEILKAIFVLTMDSYDQDGNLGNRGTSRDAVDKFTSWMSDYANSQKLNIKFKHLTGNSVNLEVFEKCVDRNGVVLLRCILDGAEHFVIMTDVDIVNAYIFDPYYLREEYFDLDEDVKIIFDEPFKYNRIVKVDRLFSGGNKNFSLGSIEKRECVTIERIKN